MRNYDRRRMVLQRRPVRRFTYLSTYRKTESGDLQHSRRWSMGSRRLVAKRRRLARHRVLWPKDGRVLSSKYGSAFLQLLLKGHWRYFETEGSKSFRHRRARMAFIRYVRTYRRHGHCTLLDCKWRAFLHNAERRRP